ISTILLPSRVEPPLGPSVKSQTLPATSEANDVGPSAARACASVGKFSTCQYSGPAGSCLSFFSATGLMSNFGCAVAVDGNSNSNNPTAHSESAKTMILWAPNICGFIVVVHAHREQSSQSPKMCIDQLPSIITR